MRMWDVRLRLSPVSTAVCGLCPPCLRGGAGGGVPGAAEDEDSRHPDGTRRPGTRGDRASWDPRGPGVLGPRKEGSRPRGSRPGVPLARHGTCLPVSLVTRSAPFCPRGHGGLARVGAGRAGRAGPAARLLRPGPVLHSRAPLRPGPARPAGDERPLSTRAQHTPSHQV